MTTRAPTVIKIKSDKEYQVWREGRQWVEEIFPPFGSEAGGKRSRSQQGTFFQNIYFDFKYLDRPSIRTELPESPETKSFGYFCLM